MNLESQVCSLELAKRLKELGIKQDSFFFYGRMEDPCFKKTHENVIIYKALWQCNEDCDYFVDCSAFNVAELDEILFSLKYKFGYLCISKHDKFYSLSLSMLAPSVDALSGADARAKMLIYLLENGLIESD